MTFLQQVAAHYAAVSPEKLQSSVFILPNKRSCRYLRRDLRRAVGDESPVGKLISVNEFFQKVYGVETTDRIPLILSLYECYKSLNPNAEALDEFIHWGRVMLSDFDNIDKYMVKAKDVFVNVSDFRDIQDTYDYLTDNQRRAIENFLSHFRDSSGRITVNMDTESNDIKARFLRVWNLLAPLYEAYNEKLSAEGMAYEGKIYRTCAEAIRGGGDIKALLQAHFPGRTRFVIVGLNALNECEKTVFRAMRNASLTEFIWDFSSREIRDGRNRASLFLRKNVEEFPQAFVLDTDGLRRPVVHVVSVPSSVGQTKLAPTILASAQGRPEETAFVLPDENLLMPLLSAVPDVYDTINVTMGYPMTKSDVYSLLRACGSLQLGTREVDGKVYFHHKALSNIAASSLFRMTLSQEEDALMRTVKEEAAPWVEAERLQHGDSLDVFFHIVTAGDGDEVHRMDNTLADAAQNSALAAYLNNILKHVSASLTAHQTDGEPDIEKDFAKRYTDIVASMNRYALAVRPATWLRLLDGLLRTESVPFEGDALEGLQIMGTLETRALDFRNLVILSANEDVFPHRSVDNSFIPPEIRKGFGLPTTEYQDAVWAYYFYRLIQRAENVWLIYDSRTEGLLSGEESRYIKQLEYHFGFKLHKHTAVAPVMPLAEDEYIEKTADDVEALRQGHLSASSLQSYLACPAKFYYQAVKGLKTEDAVTESMDAATLGTVFHACMEQLYKGKQVVRLQDIRTMLADQQALRTLVREKILAETRALDVEGRNLIIEEVVVEYVNGALRHDLNLLTQSGSDGFRILGLERFMKKEIDGFKFIGFLDRIDSYKPGEVRVVDYKTGHVEDEDILITNDNAASVVEKLFGEANTGRPKIALQLYLYDQFLREGLLRAGESVVNSIYSTARLMTTPLPDVAESTAFRDAMQEKLHGLLSEIADTSVPFRRTKDKHVCSMCDFRNICGR